MYALIYLSSYSNLQEDDIIEIATKSAVQNQKIGVTGFLTTRKKHFIQYLEGEKDNVLALMEKISRDERHKIVHIVPLENGIETLFKNWSMRYINRKDDEAELIDDSLIEAIIEVASNDYDQTMVNAQIYSVILKLSRIFHLPKLA